MAVNLWKLRGWKLFSLNLLNSFWFPYFRHGPPSSPKWAERLSNKYQRIGLSLMIDLSVFTLDQIMILPLYCNNQAGWFRSASQCHKLSIPDIQGNRTHPHHYLSEWMFTPIHEEQRDFKVINWVFPKCFHLFENCFARIKHLLIPVPHRNPTISRSPIFTPGPAPA